MKNNANTIVKALILVLGLSLSGVVRAATVKEDLKIDSSVRVVQVVPVHDEVNGHRHVVVDRVLGVPASNRVVQGGVLEFFSVEILAINEGHDVSHPNRRANEQVAVAIADQTLCPAELVAINPLRC